MKSARDVYIFVGPPGSGKGSVSNMCVQNLHWLQLSTGNLCRKHIAGGTPLGKQIEFAIKAGTLIPDNLMTELVQDWLAEHKNTDIPLIFDGYPRTLAQAYALHELLSTLKPAIHPTVVRFAVDDSEVIKRVSGRLVCQNKDCQTVYSAADGVGTKPKFSMICDHCGSALGRRKDDDPETIRARLQIYHMHEQELVNFYLNSGYSVLDLDASKPLPEVFEQCKRLAGVEEA